MRRLPFCLTILAVSAAMLGAGCTDGAKKNESSRNPEDKNTNTQAAPKTDEAAKPAKNEGGSAAQPQPVGATEGKVNAKPLEGELAEPVKRADDIDIYKELQQKLKFVPLYPGYMPPQYKVADRGAVFQAIDNGVDGFSIRYQEPGAGGVTILEGSVFDPIPGSETEQIKIRDGSAYLETIGEERYGVFFNKNGVRYGLTSDGMSKEELRKIATALVPVDSLK